jgi:hypothetical protein
MSEHFKRTKTVKKLGIMVSDLRSSTMNYNLIKLGNKIANECTNIDFYVFNEDWQPSPISICFPVLQQRNAWGFDGSLVATNLATAKKLLNLPNTCLKYFYIWNIIEWTNGEPLAQDVLDIYNNADLQLVARSKDNQFILENNFNAKAHLLKDFDYAESTKVFQLD